MLHAACSTLSLARRRTAAVAACAALALGALPAKALTVVDVQDGGNLVSTAFVGSGLVGLDVGLLGTAPVHVTLELAAGDLGQDLFFNAIVSLLQQPAAGVHVTLGGASFAAFAGLGSASALGSADVATETGDAGRSATVRAGLASTEFYLGDPLLEGGTDWRIALGTAQAGDRFSVTISAVPEPGTWALMLAGLGAVGLAGARRRG